MLDLRVLKQEPDERLWRVIVDHIEAETRGSVSATMATITGDCRYFFPFEDLALLGGHRLAPYYARLFDNWPGEVLRRQIVRYWVAREPAASGYDTILFESRNTFRMAGGEARTFPSAALLSVRDGLLSAEWIFVSHRSPWLGQAGATPIAWTTPDTGARPLLDAAAAWLVGGPADIAPTSDFVFERPYQDFAAGGAEAAALSRDLAGLTTDVRALWLTEDGSVIAVVAADGPARHRLVVLAFEGARVSRQTVYGVEGAW